MEDQTNFLLDWAYFCHGKSMEEITESLLITTMELEAARFKAQQQLKQKDDELNQLKLLLNTAVNEKLEAENRYQMLIHSEDDAGQITNGGLSSSDCEESMVSSPAEEELGFPVKALPEKGKLLEAMIKAGPLLQNLLVAGPLPHWRNPPPPLDSYQIPPPPINKKRGFPEGSDSSTDRYKILKNQHESSTCMMHQCITMHGGWWMMDDAS